MVLAHNIDEVQRTEDIQICQDTTFDTMMLSPDILYGLKSSGFIKPSPIQLLGIPLGKLGFDLLLEAKSGTGKTVVFSTIALEKLNLSNGLQVIIITPTREIAVQICDVLKQIGSKCEGLTIEVAIGGLPYQEDIDKMKKNVHILVGTPGRLKYLIQDKNVDTSAIRLFILDEADKLMEKSFKTDIKYIHSALPNQKQVIMSSATYPESVIDVINELVQDAQRVCPNSSNVLLGVSHRITYVKYNCNSVRQTEIRFEELTKILTETQFKQCVIFCKYQARVSQLHKMLTKAKWPSELVYGKQNQTVRLDALKTLQEYKCRILISTDLVSRGIDAKNVDLVINFEPPDSCETYLHRIGRSGRYGSIGMAISIVSEGVERKNFHTMLQPIESSIILQHFWTGEYINHCMNETKQTVEIKNKSECNFEQTNNNHENLWNFILCYTKDSNKIESFDQLCLSYNIISNKDEIIESFSDILQSYQNMDDNEIEDSTEYKQMKYENFLYKNYLTAVRNLKHKFEINCVNTNNGSKSNGASDGCLVYKQDNQIKSILRNNEESSQNIDYKLDIINSQIQKELQNNNHSMPRKKEENYIDATNFISQIPKAFHESACEKKHKQNIRTNEDVLKNGVSSDINSKSSKVEQKYRPSMKNHQDNKNYISPDIKLSDTNYLSLYSNHKHDELLYKKKKNNECNVNLFVKPAIINNETSYAADLDYDYGIQDVKNVDQQFNREKSYYQWYHQLKNNMKQIEQFLYIDEMNNP